ncbi:MAG: CPBP family intramembrane metalloprotease, partial [Gammaproteobacteria bacterium]|nr:CPBP family intramembrane metalloprotease [Gammaproteobacteria bacterium]
MRGGSDSRAEGREALRPWGFWTTLGWGVLGYGLIVLAQLVSIVGVALALRERRPEAALGAAAESGLALALGVLVALPLVLTVVWLAVRLRRGWDLRTYLGLRPVGWRRLLGWLALTLALEALAWSAGTVFDRPPVPEFMRRAYASAGSLPLLWVAVVVAAPLMEEPLYRGLMLRGWSAVSGPWTGAVLVSLVWSVSHVQYDLYDLAQVFVLGMVLAAARVRTGSLYVPLAMHGLVNLVAMI